MAEEVRPHVWGLWNPFLSEWFNPGTAKPYFRTKVEAHRALPLAARQYSMGRWEIREFPLTAEELDLEVRGTDGGGAHLAA